MELPKAIGVFDMSRDYGRQLQASRKAGDAADLRRWLRLPADLPKPRRIGEDRSEFRIEPEPGIGLPATLAGPDRRSALLVVVDEHGRKSAGAQELARGLTDAGYPVLGIDLRGWGETAPTTGARKNRPLDDEFFAVHGIELGRSLLAMRVLDLLAAVRLEGVAYEKIYVIGRGGGGLVALHAAALDRSISGVAAIETLRSYQEVLEQRISNEPLASFVPGALQHYDLPQLAGWISPRPCVHVEAAVRKILDGLHLG